MVSFTVPSSPAALRTRGQHEHRRVRRAADAAAHDAVEERLRLPHPDPTGANGPFDVSNGKQATIYWNVGTQPAALMPGQTYYFNFRNSIADMADRLRSRLQREHQDQLAEVARAATAPAIPAAMKTGTLGRPFFLAALRASRRRTDVGGLARHQPFVLEEEHFLRLDVVRDRPGCSRPGRPRGTAACRSGRRTRCTSRGRSRRSRRPARSRRSGTRARRRRS